MYCKKNISEYNNHPIIKDVKVKYKDPEVFNFPNASTEDTNKIAKSVHHIKATGADKIPLKLLKVAANMIDSHIANILNHYILNK